MRVPTLTRLTTTRRAARISIGMVLGAVLACASAPAPAWSHGERTQEPFLRMRTLHFYDVRWDKERIAVGEQATVKGRFHVFKEWPTAVALPDTVYLHILAPGPQVVKVSSTLNGVSMVNSTAVELGRDYEFTIVIAGRRPGQYHLHPMLSVQDGGPIAGPGHWMTVEGDFADFKHEITTMTGQVVDLERWGFGRVVLWHSILAVVALGWLGYWLLPNPLLIRAHRLNQGDEEGLITPRHRNVGIVFAVVILAIVGIGYLVTTLQFPITIPIQSSRAGVEPLADPPALVDVKLERGEYDVPGRAVRLTLRITNRAGVPLRLGEFSTANLRFIDSSARAAKPEPGMIMAHVLAEEPLAVEPGGPIAPGETKTVLLSATDPAWETERLAMLINDPDSRFGGLLMFFDGSGNRRIVPIGGTLIPQFKF